MKKKILQICAIESSVHSLLKPLLIASLNEGDEVHVACTSQGRFKELQNLGVVMHDIKIERSINLKGNLRSIKELYNLMRQENYDIVHVHTPIAALLGRVAAKLANVPNIVYTAHGYYFHDEMSPKQYKFYYNIEKYAAKLMTDWLLLQSREDYELSLRDKFKNKEKIIHLSNGVDIWDKFNLAKINASTEEISKTIENYNFEKNEIIFSFIGRLVKEKGILELIEAFTELYVEYPYIKLIIIGEASDTERDQETKEKLDSMLKCPGIYRLGYRRDIPELMKFSSVFILPSYREGLPRSIIEAMAVEKPIIATNIRGCREEVFVGENGFLVDKANKESLKQAMKRFIENPKLIDQYGKRSRELVEEFFDEKKVLEKQIKLFDQLMRRK